MARTINLTDDGTDWLRSAKDELDQGNPIIIPTDTVYGIAALSSDKSCLEKIFSIKKRDVDRPFALFFESTEQALPYLESSLHGHFKQLGDAFFPGPLTIVADASLIGREVFGATTVGIRVPSHTGVLELINSLSTPLAVTSANISGKTDPFSVDEIDEAIRSQDILIIDDGKTKFEAPSTVILLKSSSVELLREGALPFQKIEQVLYNY